MGLEVDTSSSGRGVESAGAAIGAATAVEPLAALAEPMTDALILATVAIGGIDLIRKAVAGEIGSKKS
jgi:hypothetical protein